MKSLPFVALLIPSVCPASAPPSNTIPVIAMKAGQEATVEDISIESLSLLSWHYFDGTWLEAWPYWQPMRQAMALCDSTGMWGVFSDPWLGNLGDIWCGNAWSRYYPAALDGDSAFIRTDTAGTVFTALASADSVHEEIVRRCDSMMGEASDWETLWYYDIWNEAPAWQRNRMVLVEDSLDGYTPSLFTMDSSMSEIGTTSTWSWLQFIADSMDVGHPVTMTVSTMHRILLGEWADYHTPNDSIAPTFHTLANSIRACIGMEYQEHSTPMPDPVSNRPRLLGCNAYPFRQVGIQWQRERDSTVVLGDELNTWMLEHYEQGLDSVIVLAALQDHLPVHYHPQAFGVCGDLMLWSGTGMDSVTYASYAYRIPSPAEFRMLCNDALMRQAKGIFPYSARGYPEPEMFCAGLLDEDLIPYDAPYEEWVYGEREKSDFYYAPPDSLPPFRPGFDPLFTLGSRPTTSGARAQQDYLEWKFAPYGRLWNSMRETLGEIAWIAPELSGLWWLDGTGHPDLVSIGWDGLCWAGPQCRVFTDDSEESLYFFYLDRCCVDSIHILNVSFPYDSIMPPSLYALDHSRRFIIPQTDLDDDEFSFVDTLEAGQARLVQLIERDTAADLRITRPDVTAGTGQAAPGHDFRFTAGDTVLVLAGVYNMGTEEAEEVPVSLVDVTGTPHAVIGRDTLSFGGLPLSGYETDEATAEFRWVPSTPGAYRMNIDVAPVPGEPDTLDNTTTALFLIEPRDYSTEVREDPWDMTEATGNPPAWKTGDVEGEEGWTAFTDSIGGMLEGEIDEDSLQNNRLYLAIPEQSGRWIDAEVFDHLSLAVKVDRDCDLWFGWETGDGARGSCFVEELAAGWARYAPIDLGSSLPDSLLKTAWLSFRPDQANASLVVRIGWVKLTEQEEGR